MRKMRRFKQEITPQECMEVLQRGSSGVLALLGDEDYPYALPMSYVYFENTILFHSALEGHKMDAIHRHSKCSFCVIDKDQVIPEEYTSYYRSVIAFGDIRILSREEEKQKAIEILAEKYSPHLEEGRMEEIARSFHRFCMIQLDIKHMTGKVAKELVK